MSERPRKRARTGDQAAAKNAPTTSIEDDPRPPTGSATRGSTSSKKQKTGQAAARPETPMAGSSRSAGSRLSDKAKELYAKCFEEFEDAVFHQAEIEELKITENVQEILDLANELSDNNYFALMSIDSQVFWKCRPQGLAEKLNKLDTAQIVVYKAIESTQESGIWKRTLTLRTNLHQATVDKALRHLISLKLVKQVHSSRDRARKMYMLFGLEPAGLGTAGPWFENGELDEPFLDIMIWAIEMQIRKDSWRRGPKIEPAWLPPAPAQKTTTKKAGLMAPGKAKSQGASGASATVSDQALPRDPRFCAPATDLAPAHATRGPRVLLPHPPADLDNYPTPSEILTFIDSKGFVKDRNCTLPDIKQVLNIMVWEGRVERVGTREVLTSYGKTGAAAGEGKEDLGEGAGVGDGEAEGESEGDGEEVLEVEDCYRWVRRPDAEMEEHIMPIQRREQSENGGKAAGGSGVDGDGASAGTRELEKPDPPANGFAETPCAKCPVFHLCEEGGTVDAKSCAYMDPWLLAKVGLGV